MNDLDRKIAELKGWRPEKPLDKVTAYDEAYWLDAEGKRTEYAIIGFYKCDGCAGFDHGEDIEEWSPSTDDRQALELVDELANPLFFIERYGKPGEKRWKAHFAMGYSKFLEQREDRKLYTTAYHDAIGEAPTRPEAICRAYIAAMTWIKEREAV